MSKNKIDTMMENLDFINNLKKEIINDDQIELCKKFITVNWSNNENMSGRMQEINSYLAKHVVEHLFGKYISNESFILAADELGYKFKVLNEKNVLIKYRVYYQQNAG
jgi:hypothetical protein